MRLLRGSGIEAGDGIKAGWGIVTFYQSIKARLKIEVHVKCTIVAGVFSIEGPQDVEASAITGNVAYGNVQILPTAEDNSIPE